MNTSIKKDKLTNWFNLLNWRYYIWCVENLFTLLLYLSLVMGTLCLVQPSESISNFSVEMLSCLLLFLSDCFSIHQLLNSLSMLSNYLNPYAFTSSAIWYALWTVPFNAVLVTMFVVVRKTELLIAPPNSSSDFEYILWVQ